MEYCLLSDIGKVREKNEDYCFGEIISDKKAIFSIADGMGGHKKGEFASKNAVLGVVNNLKEELIVLNNKQAIKEKLKNSYLKINDIILNKAKEEVEYKGMGTTLTTIIINDDILIIANVGDSRCYIFRDNKLKKLTVDNSLVEELLERGFITKEEAKDHPQKNIITRAVGIDENLLIDMYEYDLENNDIIILTTDGVTNSLEDFEIENILNQNMNMKNFCSKIVEESNFKSGSDNISIVSVKL
ncbi:MAG: Stp1/IreP family PP2C-type Ser/Thr phosphatase [Peptostreptococcaceae bacterium]|jgi:protein phosphatase|nr:Stp1/IreP family PP2C-type Ser/Thr phosphatase [Peptostreptococcaceae bacterium]